MEKSVMIREIQKASLLLLVILAVLSSAPALANSQFYFIAKTAPEGSLTELSQSPSAVYLRWDTVEGPVPDEITELRLTRDGQLLETFPVNAVMPASEIDSLYQGNAQERRLLETVTTIFVENISTIDFGDAKY